MSGNKAKARETAATDIEKHIELVQPRSTTAAKKDTTMPLEEREKIREKIKIRAAGRKAMAQQSIKAAGKYTKQSRLIPADGGGMGMGMEVE